MISYREALDVLAQASSSVLDAIEVSVKDALGFVLADDVTSAVPNPVFRNSAMDGFAVCADETRNASGDKPLKLEVIGIVAAGDASSQLAAADSPTKGGGYAVEIMTGAPVPPGFDAVIKVEDVAVEKDASGASKAIVITNSARGGQNVRQIGDDFRAGQVIIPAGTVVLPQHIMGSIAAGLARVLVRRKPRVAILSTGTELVECSVDGSSDLAPGKIFNSSAPFLSNLSTILGVESRYYGTVSDDTNEFIAAFEKLMADEPDVVITTGAVSMGRYDFIPAALRDLDAKVLFHKVAVRPGKPILAAKLRKDSAKEVMVFGLPGNPLSVMTGVRFFVVPYLRTLLDCPEERLFTAKMQNSIKKPGGLRRFCLGNVEIKAEGAEFTAFEKQMSFMLSPALASNAWGIFPEEGSMVEAGEEIDCVWYYPDK